MGDGLELGEDAIRPLYAVAGVEVDEDEFSVPLSTDDCLHLDGEPELHDDYCSLTVFGDEWMELAGDLVRNGKDIEIYGRIVHEHGATEYYSLNSNGHRYIGHIDIEIGDCSERSNEMLLEKWLISIPDHVKLIDPGLFARNENVLSRGSFSA